MTIATANQGLPMHLGHFIQNTWWKRVAPRGKSHIVCFLETISKDIKYKAVYKHLKI